MRPEVMNIFNYANKARQEGNFALAVQLYNEITQKLDPTYGPAHLNLSDLCRQQNNLIGERQEILAFLECPLTGRTIDFLQTAKTRLQELENILNPKPK